MSLQTRVYRDEGFRGSKYLPNRFDGREMSVWSVDSRGREGSLGKGRKNCFDLENNTVYKQDI